MMTAVHERIVDVGKRGKVVVDFRELAASSESGLARFGTQCLFVMFAQAHCLRFLAKLYHARASIIRSADQRKKIHYLAYNVQAGGRAHISVCPSEKGVSGEKAFLVQIGLIHSTFDRSYNSVAIGGHIYRTRQDCS